ncbi:unnamed protein product [Lathyrus oleraceus]
MSKQDFKKNQYCILKVNCICKGCEKKIKKLLIKIQGVDSINIDAEEGKVLVVGNVDPNEVINILKKSGKHAQICVTHNPKLPQPSKKKSSSNSNNEVKEHGSKGNDSVIPTHPHHSKGNNGNRNIGHTIPIHPMMNNGGAYHHHQMMQTQPSYGQQRFMPMPMMNQQNAHMSMIPPMHGMPHPSMMYGMQHPSMLHGMPHSSMMHGMQHPSMMHPSMMHGMPYPPMNYMTPPRHR